MLSGGYQNGIGCNLVHFVKAVNHAEHPAKKKRVRGMTKTRSITRNQNHDENASSKKVNSGDNGGVGPWSNLNHHLLYLVMMQLGVVDYLSFGGVCKSWRSLAISNKKKFMASKPPMIMRFPSLMSHKKPCYLEDFEGRNFKTILPCFSGGVFLGLTCGYLIFYKKTTRDFWLVNPITRNQLFFPDFPITDHFPNDSSFDMRSVRAILVFSLSVGQCVFLVMHHNATQIWYSIVDTGAWDYVSCKNPFNDLRAFKGTIYTLNRNRNNPCISSHRLLYELRLIPEPKLMLLETNNSLKAMYIPHLVSSDENIYVMDRISNNDYVYTDISNPTYRYMFEQLDFDKMKWVSREKKLGECATFLSDSKHGVAIKPSCCDDCGQGQRLLLGHGDGDILKVKLIEGEEPSYFGASIWYFPHECLNVDRID